MLCSSPMELTDFPLSQYLARIGLNVAPEPNEREYDLLLSYKFLEGTLRGLSFDAKGAVLDYTGSGRTGLQLRLIMNYEFNLL